MDSEVKIVPLGDFEEILIKEVGENISKTFNVSVTLSGSEMIPDLESAYDTARGQYSVTEFLQHLDLSGTDAIKVLAITDVDLYYPGLNYIFGFADNYRNISIVSASRFKKDCAEEQLRNRIIERVVKTSIHELGHIYGLAHCHNSKCVMFFSYNLFDTDYKGKDFCIKCCRNLNKKIFIH